jgi:hypothetical protein
MRVQTAAVLQGVQGTKIRKYSPPTYELHEVQSSRVQGKETIAVKYFHPMLYTPLLINMDRLKLYWMMYRIDTEYTDVQHDVQGLWETDMR